MSGATIAVDAGTSVVKAVRFDEDGRETAVARRPAVVERPGGARSEQDMTAVLRAVLDCVAEVASADGSPVARIALTAQGDGAWPVDVDGAPAGPAVLWNDGRATEVLQRWDDEGVLAAAFRTNGSLGNLGLPHTLMRWSLEHDAERLRRTSTVLTCGGWLHLALTGVRGLHVSEASAPWLDVHERRVSDELIDLYGLASVRALVPELLADDALTAPLLPGPATATGLPAGVPVTLAPYDVVATAHGSGAIAPGSAFCILGTTLCTGAVLPAAATEGAPSGLTLLDERDGAVVRAFPTLAGTGVVEWAVRLLGLASPAALTELASESVPGARGVRVWPYLSPAGERAPFLDPAARGAIGGLDLDTGPADVARAVLEGLAHVIRSCLEATGAAPEVLALAGGGAASELWCRTIADVTGVPVSAVPDAQVGARGALLSALVAAGEADDLRSADSALPRTTTVVEPEAGTAALFVDRHEDFLATREVLAGRWSSWATAS